MKGGNHTFFDYFSFLSRIDLIKKKECMINSNYVY